ncbi:MAG: KOW domain-containing RNA-binding protein [Lachnospiraceae bacterium]|nr:KOW domain-containing RNA-binding protein [Lachnospiraceae bacterium]
MVGCLAVSKAGHDKDEIYLILKEEKDFVYLADGIGRTTSTPKKKNKKHIQIIKNGLHGIPVEDVRRKLENGQSVMDEEIKYVLKQYKKENQKFTGYERSKSIGCQRQM